MPRPPDEPARRQPVADLADDATGTSSAHEEGGERVYAVNTESFLGDDDGQRRRACGPTRSSRMVDGRPTFEKVEGTDFELAVRAGAAGHGLRRPGAATACSSSSASSSTPAATSPATTRWATNVDGVFVCGDMGRGQSLIVWAIAEGRVVRRRRRPLPHGRDPAPGPARHLSSGSCPARVPHGYGSRTRTGGASGRASTDG